MEKCTETTIKPQVLDKGSKSESALQNLTAYCRSLFEIEENHDYHDTPEYRNAKRKFIKYLNNIR
jgi:hypothetical protein